MARSVKQFQEIFQKEDLTDYRCIPFWSWNSELEETELLKQMEQMKQGGCGGFIIHARLGLTTEYLGEKWFSCIEACLNKAKALKMNAWIYDENGWPSGFVGGKLLQNQDFLAQFLEYAIRDQFDEEAYCVYEKRGNGFFLVSEPTGANEYHCVYVRQSPSNTDILNPEVVDAFIKETHEKYYERFADRFGKELVGFFTDEPQYYRVATPYSPVAKQEYEKRYGKDTLRKNLIYLFLQDEQGYPFRARWYALLNELYVTNFYKKIYDWCEAHGCKLTGHSIQETSCYGQMIGSAGVMTSYEYEHIPAMDCLGGKCSSEFAPKQLGSVASQLGIQQVLTETFGCAGHDVTPRVLKSIGESQYFNGVNLMCQHLFPYSIAGQGKYDHPPVFSTHSNWWEQFRTFNDYFTKLGYIVANTKERYDVLVVHPLRSFYLNFLRKTAENVAEEENAFQELLLTFRKHGVLYHFADETLLAKYGEITDEGLKIGNCVYKTLVIPKMKSVSSTTLGLLQAYKGGLCMLEKPLYVDGNKEDVALVSNTTLEDIFARTTIKFSCDNAFAGISSRESALGDFIFVKNYSSDSEATVRFSGVSKEYRALNLEDLTVQPCVDEFTLEPHGSLILCKMDECNKKRAVFSHAEDITERFSTKNISENSFVLDYATYSLDGTTYSERLPLMQISEALLRKDYKGKLYIRQSFQLKEMMPLKLTMEKGRFLYVAINGQRMALRKSESDVNFVEADITPALQRGENVLEYAVEYYQHDGVHFALFDPMATESLRNCLYYDTHIENSYLQGDFIVEEDFALRKATDQPPITENLQKNGYPFFKGAWKLQGDYEYDGQGEREIVLEGNYLVAELYINGLRTDLALSDRKNVTQYLRKGNNQITLVLKSSLRNFFGPHHYKDAIKYTSFSPGMFTFRGGWANGEPKQYTHEYSLAPFGVKAVKMYSGK